MPLAPLGVMGDVGNRGVGCCGDFFVFFESPKKGRRLFALEKGVCFGCGFPKRQKRVCVFFWHLRRGFVYFLVSKKGCLFLNQRRSGERGNSTLSQTEKSLTLS